MKRGLARSPLLDQPNTWLSTGTRTGLWEYGNYRHCYLVIRQLENGKFMPMVGAWGAIETPDVPLPDEGYHQFDTLEQAQNFLYKYVDYVRDVRDIIEKKEIQMKLHRLNPAVFLA
jgi:hypothetical protein